MILIETTVPPGTTEYIAYPIVKKAFEKRGIVGREPLLAHSFEQVMPGRQYVSSIRDFWRVACGINDEACRRAVAFLSDVINVKKYPLTVLDRPIESETCPLPAVQLVRDALRNMGKIVAACRIAVLGVSYREDVGDTRYSGSEILVRKLTEMGVDVVVHDPYVRH